MEQKIEEERERAKQKESKNIRVLEDKVASILEQVGKGEAQQRSKNSPVPQLFEPQRLSSVRVAVEEQTVSAPEGTQHFFLCILMIKELA